MTMGCSKKSQAAYSKWKGPETIEIGSLGQEAVLQASR